LQASRPQRRTVARARQGLAGGAPPAFTGKVAERLRDRPGDRHLHVVVRSPDAVVDFAATRVAGPVLGGVPTPAGEIEATGKRQPVVDDDDLLMMRTAQRTLIVHVETDAAMCLPVQAVDRQPLAMQRHQHREVPVEHVNPQAPVLPHQTVEECAQFRAGRAGAGLTLGQQPQATVDVPGQDQHLTACEIEGVIERREVFGAVDQKGDLVGATDTPAVTARFEYLVLSHRAGCCGAVSVESARQHRLCPVQSH
jgi:hypothetical protein